MTEIEYLTNALARITPSNHEIPLPMFDEISMLVENESTNEAKKMIEESFKNGRFDIRLISYYLYGHFVENGILGLKTIFPCFINILTHHEKTLTPIVRTRKQIESSFKWFISSIINKIEYNEKLYQEKKPSTFWEKSTTQLNHLVFKEISQETLYFNDFIKTFLPEAKLEENILKVDKKIKDLEEYVEPLVLAIDPLNEIVADENVDLKVPEHNSQTLSKECASNEMILLIKKLQVFDALIEKKNFLKAAIVSKDISQLIENFDPTLFFPKLFAQYFVLLAKHFAMISQETKGEEALQWQYLDKLYRIDMEEFIKW